jgi:hypothetical protein
MLDQVLTPHVVEARGKPLRQFDGMARVPVRQRRWFRMWSPAQHPRTPSPPLVPDAVSSAAPRVE